MNKRVTLEYVLCVFGGLLGLHKFYNKEFGKGFLYLFTVGLFGFGWIRDIILIYKRLPLKDTTSKLEVKDSTFKNKELTEEDLERLEAKKELKRQKTMARRSAINERVNAINQAKLNEKERIKTMDREGTAYCPKCKGTSIQYVERRKQLSVGRAVVGSMISPVAGVVGAVTSKKFKGFVKCLNCGNQWKM